MSEEGLGFAGRQAETTNEEAPTDRPRETLTTAAAGHS